MKSSEVLISPEIAANMLSKNTINRPIRERRVLNYSSLMKDGKWRLNGESIKIAKSGELLDGQHRLLACIKANCSFRSVVITELDRSVFATLDTGAARSGADVLNINSAPNSTSIASGITFYLKCRLNQQSDQSKHNLGIYNEDILDEYNKRPDYWQMVQSKSVKIYDKIYRVIPPSACFGYFAIFQELYSLELAESFFDNMSNKIGAPGLLFDRLLKNSLSKQKISTREKNGLIIKSFLMHVEGVTPKLLKLSSDEKYPELK